MCCGWEEGDHTNEHSAEGMGERCRGERREAEGEMEGDTQSTVVRRREEMGKWGKEGKKGKDGINKSRAVIQKKNRAILQKVLVGWNKGMRTCAHLMIKKSGIKGRVYKRIILNMAFVLFIWPRLPKSHREQRKTEKITALVLKHRPNARSPAWWNKGSRAPWSLYHLDYTGNFLTPQYG